MAVSCNRNRNVAEYTSSAATDASEAGVAPPLPADVLLVTRSLINGQLYSRPSFEGMPLVHFDTTQLIQVLDTSSNAIFVKARIRKDTAAFTGYVSRAILPEE
ncbi:hypothetical protein I2I11_00185 [Pontibacter sp. 172403-2]|nr:hypothetical protein [Pontibacter sp. 172403-2]